MSRSLLLIAVALLWCSCGPSNRSHQPAAEHGTDAPRPVSLAYRIVANVVPESLLVRTEVEIDVQNIYRDSFTYMLLLQPSATESKRKIGRHSRIERLLLNGSPVQSTGVSTDSSVILLPLASAVGPGERVALSLSVAVRVTEADRWTYLDAECIQFRDWLPRVVLGAAQTRKRMTLLNDPADFEVSLTVDSGWFVVAPGELLNDKELLGMVPNGDSVFVDVIHRPYAADGYLFSRLPSENGRDTYEWRALYRRGFDFLVLKNYLLDRGRKGDFAAEAYYPQELAAVWQHRIVAEGLDYFGSRPMSTLKEESLKLVVAGERSIWFSSNIQSIPFKSKKLKFLPPKGAR